MKTIERRVRRLETSVESQAPQHVIVIFDADTGEALTPIVGNPAVEIWLPDNKRDYVYEGEAVCQ